MTRPLGRTRVTPRPADGRHEGPGQTSAGVILAQVLQAEEVDSTGSGRKVPTVAGPPRTASLLVDGADRPRPDAPPRPSLQQSRHEPASILSGRDGGGDHDKSGEVGSWDSLAPRDAQAPPPTSGQASSGPPHRALLKPVLRRPALPPSGRPEGLPGPITHTCEFCRRAPPRPRCRLCTHTTERPFSRRPSRRPLSSCFSLRRRSSQGFLRGWGWGLARGLRRWRRARSPGLGGASRGRRGRGPRGDEGDDDGRERRADEGGRETRAGGAGSRGYGRAPQRRRRSATLGLPSSASGPGRTRPRPRRGPRGGGCPRWTATMDSAAGARARREGRLAAEGGGPRRARRGLLRPTGPLATQARRAAGGAPQRAPRAGGGGASGRGGRRSGGPLRHRRLRGCGRPAPVRQGPPGPRLPWAAHPVAGDDRRRPPSGLAPLPLFGSGRPGTGPTPEVKEAGGHATLPPARAPCGARDGAGGDTGAVEVGPGRRRCPGEGSEESESGGDGGTLRVAGVGAGSDRRRRRGADFPRPPLGPAPEGSGDFPTRTPGRYEDPRLAPTRGRGVGRGVGDPDPWGVRGTGGEALRRLSRAGPGER